MMHASLEAGAPREPSSRLNRKRRPPNSPDAPRFGPAIPNSSPWSSRSSAVAHTSNFFAIDRGDVLLLDGRVYVIAGTARERGFGLDDEPKHWVKRAIDGDTGEPKIIKLVFQEQFTQRLGGCTVRCFRSPAKEARVLERVRGHPHFMTGFAVRDAAGNDVRIIDLIRGPTLDDVVTGQPGTHERYFLEQVPQLLGRLWPCLDALRFLNEAGERHGDVRADHVMVDRKSGLFRWIDFDYDFTHPEAPFSLDILGVGKILALIVGKGVVDAHRLERDPGLTGVLARLCADDLAIVDRASVMNLGKVYPYIPEALNRVLRHFSSGAEVFYETVGQLLEDLGDAMTRLVTEDAKEIRP